MVTGSAAVVVARVVTGVLRVVTGVLHDGRWLVVVWCSSVVVVVVGAMGRQSAFGELWGVGNWPLGVWSASGWLVVYRQCCPPTSRRRGCIDGQ